MKKETLSVKKENGKRYKLSSKKWKIKKWKKKH